MSAPMNAPMMISNGPGVRADGDGALPGGPRVRTARAPASMFLRSAPSHNLMPATCGGETLE
jgi:hypothetical protein